MSAKSERRLQALLGHLRPEGGRPATSAVSGTPAYRYTLSGNGMLSDEQRAAYERDGFVVVPGLVSGAELRRYTERFRDLCTGAVKTPGLTIMKDVSIAKSEFKKDERAITKVQNYQVRLNIPRRTSSTAVLSTARRSVEGLLPPARHSAICGVLHWPRHHGHAYHADQQAP